MKKTTLALCTQILIATPLAIHSQEHAHQHHSSKSEATLRPSSPSREQFKADDNLKSRMQIIKQAMSRLHTKDKAMTTEQVKATGSEIESTVNDIFKNCKLPPAADEAIHPILADLLTGADLLKEGKSHQGHGKVHSALLKYDKIFIP